MKSSKCWRGCARDKTTCLREGSQSTGRVPSWNSRVLRHLSLLSRRFCPQETILRRDEATWRSAQINVTRSKPRLMLSRASLITRPSRRNKLRIISLWHPVSTRMLMDSMTLFRTSMTSSMKKNCRGLKSWRNSSANTVTASNNRKMCVRRLPSASRQLMPPNKDLSSSLSNGMMITSKARLNSSRDNRQIRDQAPR